MRQAGGDRSPNFLRNYGPGPHTGEADWVGEGSRENKEAMSEVKAANPEARRPSLPALTAVRAFTAINILLFHFSDPKMFGPLAPVIDGGYVSVSFFFVLSGYIMAYNYGERAQNGTLNKGEFWSNRLARLYPVFLLSLVICWQMLALEWHAQARGMFWLGGSADAVDAGGVAAGAGDILEHSGVGAVGGDISLCVFSVGGAIARGEESAKDDGAVVGGVGVRADTAGALHLVEAGWAGDSGPLFCGVVDTGAEVFSGAASADVCVRDIAGADAGILEDIVQSAGELGAGRNFCRVWRDGFRISLHEQVLDLSAAA